MSSLIHYTVALKEQNGVETEKNDLLNVSYQICMNCWPKTKKFIEKSNIVCNGRPSFLWLWIGVKFCQYKNENALN